MQTSLQKHLIPLFHYALKPEGFLWLGSSEHISGFGELFETTEPKQKIFKRKPGTPTISSSVSVPVFGAYEVTRTRIEALGRITPDVQREADRLTAAKYARPA
jgi:two-component system, chemotaxis family, CheB/CheR fusion protein